jgi:hypothetical protein
MDSQFTTLLKSYSDNYIQFKVTGSASYKNGYTSAQQGLDSIISQLQDNVNAQKQQISDFYKSGVEQKILDLDQRNKFLQRGIVSEQDEITAARMRAETPISPTSSSIQTWQYVTLGILGATAVGLSIL